jgi:acetyltransferase-like isoleucine patch superfamily enzyme
MFAMARAVPAISHLRAGQRAASSHGMTERVLRAVHARLEVRPDPDFELGLAEYLRSTHDLVCLLELYRRFAVGDGAIDQLMRRAVWRAGSRSFGHGVRIDPAVGFKHLETVEVGDGVFIGAQAFVQGRVNGTCRIGNHVWIGPQSFLDARDLVLEDYVGWGPGAKVLGSEHTGVPADVPIIQTDLRVKRVLVKRGADIGTGAVLLPGITVGADAIVGAGAVVTDDVPDRAIVAGVPARLLRYR